MKKKKRAAVRKLRPQQLSEEAYRAEHVLVANGVEKRSLYTFAGCPERFMLYAPIVACTYRTYVCRMYLCTNVVCTYRGFGCGARTPP